MLEDPPIPWIYPQVVEHAGRQIPDVTVGRECKLVLDLLAFAVFDKPALVIVQTCRMLVSERN